MLRLVCRALSSKPAITPETGPLNSLSFSICGSPPQLQGHHQAREQGASNSSVFQVLGSGKDFRGAGNEMQSLGRVDDTDGGPKMHAQVPFHLWLMMWDGRETVFSRGCFYPPSQTLEDVFTSLVSSLSLRTGCLQGRVV